jgi:predicted dehydrogenase
MIRLGMIGAGVFARDAHAPALNNLSDTYEVVAVYSRTENSAQKLANLFSNGPQIYTELDELLARDDIDAVDITMPIYLLPETVRRALATAKHVISEKPVAPTVAEGKQLLQDVHRYGEQIWMVAENWRYEDSMIKARNLVGEGQIGTPYLFHWAIHIQLDSSNKYYQTAWRRDNSHPGGYILDGGVHHIAALRLILGEVKSVAAHSTQNRPDLPPIDTVAATIEMDSGLIGTYAVTYAKGVDRRTPLHIIGSEGELQVLPGEVKLIREGQATQMFEGDSIYSVEKELAAFARAINHGEEFVATPEQALQDVALVEAFLESARQGKHITPARVV